MAGFDVLTGVEWVVACLAPRDIAPHPNFRVSSVTPLELFALLIELEVADFEEYQSGLEPTNYPARDASLELLNAARATLESGTQRDGMLRLFEMAQKPQSSFGIRVAAALMAAVVASELDEFEQAVHFLKSLLEQARNYATTVNGSTKLLRAALAQQLAIRLLESGDIEQAYSYSNEAYQTLSLEGDELWDHFSVSQGISWDSRQSQVRVAELLRGNAMALRAFLGDDSSNEWVDVVRSSPSIAELPPIRGTLRGLAHLVDEKFRERFEASGSSRTLRIGGDPVLQPMYAALMHAELAGSLSEIRKLRELIGQTLMLRSADEDLSHSVAEAIRLLRQSDSETSLKRLLRTIRIHGPIEVIGDSGSRLLANKESLNHISQADLYLIEAAADLLSPPMRSKAIEAALAYPIASSDRRLGPSASARWKKLEDSLRVTSILLPESDADDTTARQVLIWAKKFRVERQSLTFSAVVKLAEAVQWDRVSQETVYGWRKWLSNLSASFDAGKLEFLRLAEVLGAPLNSREILIPEDSEYVAWLVNRNLSGRPISSTELAAAVQICAKELIKDVELANKGTIEGHLYSPAELAAYLIAACGAIELWDPLNKFLANPRVAGWDKVAALNRLTYSPLNIPDEIRAQIREAGAAMLSAKASDRLGPRVNMLPSAWRKFAVVNSFISLNSAQLDIIADAASPHAQLRAAAADIAALFLDRSPGVDWPAVLLLQISRDQNSSVRAAAARNLAYISTQDLVAQQAVQERVRQLLFEPGVGLPMAILRGLLRSVEQQYRSFEDADWWVSDVTRLSRSHPSSLIRGRALRLLSSTSSLGGAGA